MVYRVGTNFFSIYWGICRILEKKWNRVNVLTFHTYLSCFIFLTPFLKGLFFVKKLKSKYQIVENWILWSNLDESNYILCLNGQNDLFVTVTSPSAFVNFIFFYILTNLVCRLAFCSSGLIAWSDLSAPILCKHIPCINTLFN